ncbi:MAG TPA: pantoate--beta-alanine ligase [Bacteroidota bacterium]|nr:pantoate--beta-alanine ligase [Bacteroidota bacterium]
MEIIRSVPEMRRASAGFAGKGRVVGIVPTMGYLHDGHVSLIRHARSTSDVVITTIFVNPAQFGPSEDFDRYPRDFERDERTARDAGTDILFAPGREEMYPEDYRTFVVTEGVSTILEGEFRPTHFRGVTTVVAKLLNITRPEKAMFGQKDAQQAFIVQRMVRDLNFDTEVVVRPIVREADGIAMSSRNAYLSKDERGRATVLYASLQYAARSVAAGERDTKKIASEMRSMVNTGRPEQIDYISFIDPERFAIVSELPRPSVLVALAVRFGRTRLIDNIMIDIP